MDKETLKNQIVQRITLALSQMAIRDVIVQLDPSPEGHGDYATNVAMVLAKRVGKNPMEIAEEIKNHIIKHQKTSKDPLIKGVEIAPPGFINLHLFEAKLISQISEVLNTQDAYGTSQTNKGKTVMVEYAHPNTHKSFHIGHLRNIATGESVVRLLEATGYRVIRSNYQGDVGMHIAKALYALLRISNIKNQISKIKSKDVKTKVEFLGKAYASGSRAFDEDQAAQEAIKDINFLIYAAAQRLSKEKGVAPSSTDYMTFVHGRIDEVDAVYALWKETRQWSLDYFESIYKRVGSHFDRYYFEGECLAGVDLAQDAVARGILKRSDGAIIFDGKPYGLDTRVFVNSLGLPTYEAKELALAEKEFSEFGQLDRVIHVVAPEQASFFKVTFKVEELLDAKKYTGKQYHLIYGWVKLKKGKMSSRSGNVVLGQWLLDEAKKEIYNILQKSASKYSQKQQDAIAEKAALAAVKYSFLRVSTGSEIAFDVKESVSFEGDSGPYLQYTYARCKSVLRKARKQESKKAESASFASALPVGRQASRFALNREERSVARLLAQFPDVVEAAATQYAPNSICSYLFTLAQQFNLFYAKHSILGQTRGEDDLKRDALEVVEFGDGEVDALKNQKLQSSRIRGRELPSSLLKTSQLRLALTAATSQVLKNGLYLLGIDVLEQM